MVWLIFLLSLVLHTNAQNAVINKRVKNNNSSNGLTRNPFLSTTLSTTITYSETASASASASSLYLDFDTTRKSMFTDTLSHFLTKIFHDQQVYNVKIISVNIFDDHVLKDGHVDEEATTQQLVKQQRSSSFKGNNNPQKVALSFSTVISAEYTSEDDINSIANENFRKMLIHVCDKFQDHLMKYIKELNDPYFMDIESVTLSDFVRYDSVLGTTTNAGGGAQNENEQSVLGMSKETVNVISIVVIVIGGLATLALLYASVKFYRKEKQLKAQNWRSKEIISLNGGTAASSIHSPGELNRAMHPTVRDDFSFNPAGLSGYTTGAYTDYRDDNVHDDPINNENPSSMNNEEEIAFSSVWPQSGPPALFPAPGSTTTAAANKPPSPPKLSYTQELQTLPQQHVFAPPGKIGVAIDVINGQPTVHKVRRGSPLEKMLQPNDVILAIDDEDTSCLSAADVTSMMVKRMDRVRKITFVRRE